MIVQIDGETIEVCEQVKIIYEIGDPETESGQELHVALTDEGLIADVIEEGEVVNTTAIDLENLFDRIA